MDFFGIGAGELFLIIVVALLVWGPGRIVEVGRTLGKVSRTIRKASSEFTTQLTREWEEEEKSHPPETKEKPVDGK